MLHLMPKFLWLHKKSTVLIVGAFRSGTNATKSCLERFFWVDAVFNRWFWKHGLAPSFTENPVPEDVQVLLLCRHPLAWVLAMHRFWRERRPELNVPQSFSEFLRKPFVVYDNTGSQQRPHYYFSSPLDYWNRYYYSWLEWGDISQQRTIVQCERIVSDADDCLTPIAKASRWRRHESGKLILPTSRVGPWVSPAEGDELALLSQVDKNFILNCVDHQVAHCLGYELT